ncbi:hypothetical protein PG985_006952 [Apiospora marii]|uniref:Uncharacterized protein n=1 Tax=Apiospora marii TaxID=335849 RepID=A0ABR1SH44_9PEZI
MEACCTSKDTLVPDPEIPPPPTQVPELVGDARFAEPPTQIPEVRRNEREAEDRAVIRVAIWRAEVNAAAASLEPLTSCACSLLTHRQPVTAWCPNCQKPLGGLEYKQFEDGRGLTRQQSGRKSIANVWPVQSPRDNTQQHRHRSEPRGTRHLFSINEFAVLGHKLLAKTKLNRVFGGGSRASKRAEPYVEPEYGGVPGSVAELEPEYDPLGNPRELSGPEAANHNPALEQHLMRRRPPAKLGDSVPKTEMYRSLRDNPGLYMEDRPSVSSLLDEWSSSSGDGAGRGGKPKLTLDATTARLRRAQILLYKTSGGPAICPDPTLARTTPNRDTTNTLGT